MWQDLGCWSHRATFYDVTFFGSGPIFLDYLYVAVTKKNARVGLKKKAECGSLAMGRTADKSGSHHGFFSQQLGK